MSERSSSKKAVSPLVTAVRPCWAGSLQLIWLRQIRPMRRRSRTRHRIVGGLVLLVACSLPCAANRLVPRVFQVAYETSTGHCAGKGGRETLWEACSIGKDMQRLFVLVALWTPRCAHWILACIGYCTGGRGGVERGGAGWGGVGWGGVGWVWLMVWLMVLFSYYFCGFR